MRARESICMLLISLVLFGVTTRVYGADGLRKNFYKKSCPQAEDIVRNITWGKVPNNPTLGAKLLRLHYHDCFVRGCDASLLLDRVGTIPTEKDARPSSTLAGFDTIEEIKARLEVVCKGVVSCADILSLAARDSVSFPFQKPMWDVLTGRRDGNVSLASEVAGNIPSPFSNFTILNQIFKNKKLTVNDLVVLSGAHTVGVAHCGVFSNRLYNFTGKGDADPSLNGTYANFLKTQCPNPANPATTVEMDPQSSLKFDSNYYNILVQNKGLFTSDAALLTDKNSAKIAKRMQILNDFLSEFGKSMKKMGAVEVLTGNAGQIRTICSKVN